MNDARRFSDLLMRIVFGVLMLAVALWCTLYSPLSFYALLLIVALLMYAEWLELTQESPFLNRFGGLIYVGVPVWSLIYLENAGESAAILPLFLMVWTTDIAAYFTGRFIGKTPLAPAISPKKTWEGLAGGVLATALTGMACSFFVPFPTAWHHGLWVGAALAIIGQIGDLFESWLKRRAGVKDSSALIPGHGGILDRVDALVFAAPCYALFYWLMLMRAPA